MVIAAIAKYNDTMASLCIQTLSPILSPVGGSDESVMNGQWMGEWRLDNDERI